MEYQFNSEISEALTIPSSWYHGAESLKRDYQKVFYRSWNMVGRSDQVAKAGDHFPAEIGEEKLIIVRGEDETIRGLFNVCRHRAGPIVTSAGNSKSLRCQYHSWTYSLDGKLQAVPEFEGVKNFDLKECKLPEVQVRIWGPLVFAAINPIMSFEEFVGQGPEDLKICHMEEMKFFVSKDYHVKCNWKVYVDNYLEAYHLPSVHPELTRQLDYKNYRVDTFRWYSTQDAAPRAASQLYAGGDRPGAYYYWMFPNLMFNIYQGMLQTNRVIPVNDQETIVRFDWFVRGDEFEEVSKKMPELMRFSDHVQEEDKSICEHVSQNLKSSSYSQGRFSVKRENGVHHFHGLLAEMLKS
jgi:choline monooxygenase